MTYTRVEMFDIQLGFHLPVQTILMSTVRALIQSISFFLYMISQVFDTIRH